MHPNVKMTTVKKSLESDADEQIPTLQIKASSDESRLFEKTKNEFEEDVQGQNDPINEKLNENSITRYFYNNENMMQKNNSYSTVENKKQVKVMKETNRTISNE